MKFYVIVLILYSCITCKLEHRNDFRSLALYIVDKGKRTPFRTRRDLAGGNCLFEVSDDGKVGVVSERNDLLVDHKSEDSGHGGASVVELDGALGELLFLVEGVPSEVDVSVAEVTDELVSGSWDVLHETDLEEPNEGDELDESGGWDGVRSDEGGDTVGEGVEGISLEVDASGEEDTGTGGDLSEEGEHTNASVLDLDVSESVESLLVDVTVQQTEGIEESERGLGAELVLEGLDGGGGGGLLLGGGERGGGGEDGCENGGLHGD